MINLCIVGSGDVVRDRHAPILKDLSKEVRVVAIVSRRQHAFEEVQKVLGYKTKRYESLEEALKQGIDAALVAVTPSSTLDVATYLTHTGIPQYVEKPIAGDVISGAKFVEDIMDRKLPLVIGENFQNQERFSTARAMVESCGHKQPTHIVVRDTLRRGLRANPRTDDELFIEHFVHIVSSARALTGENIQKVMSCEKRIIGSISEYIIKCELESGALLEVQLNLTNTWSEDHYSLIFKDADIKINHVYSHETKKYTDTLEHWHGPEELVEVVTIANADCGMSKCWDEFLQMVKTGAKTPSPSLMNALNDLQVREAVSLSRSTGNSIPVIKLT